MMVGSPASGRSVAVLGTGVIGASWAALLLARGFTVRAWDPAPGAEVSLRCYVDDFLPGIVAAVVTGEAAHDRLHVHSTAESAVEGVEFVQESGPERLDLKQALFAHVDRSLAPNTVIASSSSTLMASDMQAGCAMPGRILVGHPFNPPHAIPLVEVVGGAKTEPWAIDRALEFYRELGKHPILLKREARGHVANRLQAALWQEALHLVREGIADAGDVDAAITFGPGLRWSVVGPLMGLHLSGGDGGIAALFEKPLWREVERIWNELGHVTVDDALTALLTNQIAAGLDGYDSTTLARQRDKLLQVVVATISGERNEDGRAGGGMEGA